MFKLLLAIAMACILQVANATPATQVDLLFQGYGLTPYGGPVADLLFSMRFPADAPDLSASSPNISVFAADVGITTGGISYQSFGYLQMRSNQVLTGESSLYFTIAFPGETFPGQNINTQISGVDIALHDSTGRMVVTDQLGDLNPDFASYVTSFSVTEHMGGWGPGRGSDHDETGNSLATAKFTSMVTTVDEPAQILLLPVGLVALLLIRRRSRRAV